jgi:hypothetical protein
MPSSRTSEDIERDAAEMLRQSETFQAAIGQACDAASKTIERPMINSLCGAFVACLGRVLASIPDLDARDAMIGAVLQGICDSVDENSDEPTTIRVEMIRHDLQS